MRWRGKLYLDTVLPFGLRSAPKILPSYCHTVKLSYCHTVLLSNRLTILLSYCHPIISTVIPNCTFRDSFGSALGVVNSHVALRGYNSFFNGCRKCSNRGCYSVHRCYGGGVQADNSSVSFNGSTTFSNNSASLYGQLPRYCNSLKCTRKC